MKIQKFSEIYYVPKSDNPTSVSTCHGIHRQCDSTRHQSNILVPMAFFLEMLGMPTALQKPDMV